VAVLSRNHLIAVIALGLELAIYGGVIAPVNAQTSAGQLLQQNRELEPQPPLLPEVTRESEQREIKPLELKPGQLTFVVKRFVFVGNTKVVDNELQSLVANFVGKTITFEDLKLITDAVTDYYQDKGYLVRAILPQQDITDGVVTIRVIEAKLGNIKIDNRSKRVSDVRIEQWIYGLIPKASELSLKELDRAILTLNDLPDISVAGTLEEGAKPGDTVLLLTVTDKPFVNGQVTADNYGDSNSGRARASALVNVNSPLGIGDQLSVYGMYSQGNSYGRLAYTLPLGGNGLRVGVNGSSMSYRVLNNNFQSAYVNGFANTGGVEATYPIIRTRPMNLVSILNWNYNQFRNWSNGSSVPENSYDTNVAQYGASGNLIDGLFGGGLSTASLIASSGNIQKNASTVAGQAAGVAGNFSKLRYALNRNQAITETFSVYLGISGQLASKNMDSSEQLYLGGPMNVRAYSSGQGAASQGNLTTLELRQNLPYQTQAIAFYDLGNVQVNKFNTQNLAYNNYVLQGYGLGVNWIGPYGVSLKGSWAQRSGQLSQAVSTYLSQNGGTSLNRFWITGSIQF
jgi:hemolysin activation/secretion protein